MKQFGMVLGVAAVAVVAGCKDPDFKRSSAPAQNEVKNAAPVEVATPPPPPPAIKVVEAPTCSCPPGTKHTSPCACGAADCACIVTPKPVPPPKPAEPEYTVYVVQNGDYLAKISKRFNVTIDSIKRLNGLKSDMIRVGQKLKIPGKVDVGEQKSPVVRKAGAKPAAAAAYAGATKDYVVKSGDTLGAIAYGNGINIRQLKAMNGLSGDSLKVGQKLKIPAEKVVKAEAKSAAKPGAKVAKAAAKKTEAKPAATAAAPAPTAEPVAAPAAEEEAPAAPEAAATEAAPVASSATPATFPYTVQEGEDITSIVVKFGVGAAEIRELNNLGESDTLKAGQTIKLPAEAQQ